MLNCFLYAAVLCTAQNAFAQKPFSFNTIKALFTPARNFSNIQRSVLQAAKTHQAVRPLLVQHSAARLNPPVFRAPGEILRSVFTLQQTPQTHAKITAFALEVDGEVWGVTTRHGLQQLEKFPFLSVPDQNNQPLLTQIFPLKSGSVHGVDISVFRFPSELRPFIRPLKPAESLPPAHATLQSAGFARNKFVWQADRETLFASHHRILTRHDPDFSARMGYCGAPVLWNGQVAGVHAGTLIPDTSDEETWLRPIFGEDPPPLHAVAQAVPVEAVVNLIRAVGQSPTRQRVQPLFFKGILLGKLAAYESVRLIRQVRNGKIIKEISAYPFMDYRNLERFLDLAPADNVQIFVQQGDEGSFEQKMIWYEWDGTTNRVTRHE